MAHLLGRSQLTPVVAIAPELASPPNESIHAPRNSHGKPGDSPRDGNLVVRFDEQVNVVALHREVDHPKPRSRGPS
jgi:hypothetical protein